MSGNVLFVTIDQLRADCLAGALSAHVPTPHLDAFAGQSAVFASHYTVTAPCGPARASLLTGLYAHHHGAVRNGTPLARRHTNIALEVRGQGIEPLLFGYTDSQPDPAGRPAEDPDLKIYENVMPGFREICEMRLEHGFEWPGHLRALGYPVAVPLDPDQLFVPKDGRLGGPALYDAKHSDTAYLTDETIKALDIRRGKGPWFAHVTYIRPHPPWVAPAPWHTLIDPATVPPPVPRDDAPAHPFVEAWFSAPSNFGLFAGFDGECARMDAATTAILRATYLSLLAEVDHHLGRLLAWLEDSRQAGDTLVIVTADHGEMLGDYGMWGKDSVFEQAFHVPLVIRAPGIAPSRIEAFTESIDIAPTILEWLGAPVPPAFDGMSLLSLLEGRSGWDGRDHAFMEIELNGTRTARRFERALETPGLRAEIKRSRTAHHVRFTGEVPPLRLPV